MLEAIWLYEAAKDLKAIGVHIARDNKRAAFETLTRIKTAADSLALHPHMGRPGRIENTRELSISGIPYIIAYQVKPESIRILAVLHTARKWPVKLDEEGNKTL